ncbi:pro-resilin-like isoform X15 [Eriocheir sinensis]|uniref:pro-resilin-like isoform X8 n=1 Tax=Eriocheir sinensis TaxID=95602 RepID=UPI0021C7096A|nr:pro-resilin-like isoform X8 [Eriocheir sinensis]XP_050728912.1 pro-resilin-like isoform X15 [Eriocheir sinensis]
MNTKVLLLLAMAAFAAADRGYGRRDSGSFESFESRSFESDEAKYDFQWAVNHPPSGNDFGQREGRDGDNTQGVYTVALPDGRRQTVTYHVDGDDGYIADVRYSGEARFPDSDESHSFESRESYRRPRPSYYFGSNESK